MEIKEFKVGGKRVQFVNDSRGTRSGFAHDTTLFINGYREAEHTCHYLNRTWECYTYQTVMKCAVRDAIDSRTVNLKYYFMRDKGYQKLTAKRKEEFEAVCKKDPEIKLFNAVYAKL